MAGDVPRPVQIFIFAGVIMARKTRVTRETLIQLAYLARRHRIVNPRGTFRRGCWYPDELRENGIPAVRSPSRNWPYTYLLACRTLKWVRQLPLRTIREDAASAERAIETGRLRRDEYGAWRYADKWHESVPVEN